MPRTNQKWLLDSSWLICCQGDEDDLLHGKCSKYLEASFFDTLPGAFQKNLAGVFRIHSWSIAGLCKTKALGRFNLYSAASHRGRWNKPIYVEFPPRLWWNRPWTKSSLPIIWDTITQHFMPLSPMYEMHHSKGSYVFNVPTSQHVRYWRWLFPRVKSHLDAPDAYGLQICVGRSQGDQWWKEDYHLSADLCPKSGSLVIELSILSRVSKYSGQDTWTRNVKYMAKAALQPFMAKGSGQPSEIVSAATVSHLLASQLRFLSHFLTKF